MTVSLNYVEKFVHIFRLILLISIGSIQAQRIDTTLYDKLVKDGQWKSIYRLNEDSKYNFIEKSATIDSIHFTGNDMIERSVLKQLFRPILGLSDANRVKGQLRTIQDAYVFINEESSISFARYGKKKVAAVVDFNPQFKSQIGGILGASRGKDGQWLTTGEIDLHLENSRRKGTIMDLRWKQPDASSRIMHFSLETPFPFGFPFGALVAFNQDFIEKQYLLESKSGLATGIGPMGRWKIGGTTESVKDMLNNTSFNSESVNIGFSGDRRNNRWLPYNGFFWDAEFSLGRLEDEMGKTMIQESKFRIDKFWPIKVGVLFLSIRGKSIYVDNREIVLAKKIKFGGGSSVRGYNENQFVADWMFIQTVEWLLGGLDRSQVFLFVDTPISNSLVIHPGYGLGFRQYNGVITLDISFGFTEWSSGGKIHLKFSSDL